MNNTPSVRSQSPPPATDDLVAPLPGPLGEDRDPCSTAWDDFYERWEIWCGIVSAVSVRGYRRLATTIGMRIRRDARPAGAMCLALGTPARILSVVGGDVAGPDLAMRAIDCAVHRADSWIRKGRIGRVPRAPPPHVMRGPSAVDVSVSLECGHDEVVSLVLSRGSSARSLRLLQGQSQIVLYRLLEEGMDRLCG